MTLASLLHNKRAARFPVRPLFIFPAEASAFAEEPAGLVGWASLEVHSAHAAHAAAGHAAH